MTGSNDGLVLPCQNCGGTVPSNAKRCPRCGKEIDTEEESVKAILEELSSILNDGDGDEGDGTSMGEGTPDGLPDQVDSAPGRPERRVRYRKVRDWPP